MNFSENFEIECVFLDYQGMPLIGYILYFIPV